MKNKKLLYGTFAIIVLTILSIGFFLLSRPQPILRPTEQITNFEECARAGYPVGESHPRQCWTADGRHFVEEIIIPEEYYGSSTYGFCQIDNDCFVSGCNTEICQSRAEEPRVTICILPDKPTPKQLNYGCQCVNQECQWAK